MPGRFDGKVLFATGGCSGLAAATARRFASEGGRVALVDLDVERAREVADGLPGSIALQADVADETAVRGAVQAAREQLGSIDCVFNAAGHADFGPIEDWSWERWNRMLTVHVGGTFLVCREAIPIMREQGAGAIVNVASIAALVSQPGNARRTARRRARSSTSRARSRSMWPRRSA